MKEVHDRKVREKKRQQPNSENDLSLPGVHLFFFMETNPYACACGHRDSLEPLSALVRLKDGEVVAGLSLSTQDMRSLKEGQLVGDTKTWVEWNSDKSRRWNVRARPSLPARTKVAVMTQTYVWACCGKMSPKKDDEHEHVFPRNSRA